MRRQAGVALKFPRLENKCVSQIIGGITEVDEYGKQIKEWNLEKKKLRFFSSMSPWNVFVTSSLAGKSVITKIKTRMIISWLKL